MEAMRESWTDERLDDFRGDVGQRFDKVDQRFDRVDKRFDKIDVELHRINDRLDAMNKALVFGAVTLSGSMVAGFVTMTALIVTQL
jgi:uncharacterized sporulation protein YeaH/YhbH (DUF444 family)